MAITISRANADTYFSINTHLMGTLWQDDLSELSKNASIVHAQRIIERHLGISDIERETASDYSQYRPDYAVYEQALWMLINNPLQSDGTKTGVKWPSVSGEGEPTQFADIVLAPEAKRWLLIKQGSGARTMRG